VKVRFFAGKSSCTIRVGDKAAFGHANTCCGSIPNRVSGAAGWCHHSQSSSATPVESASIGRDNAGEIGGQGRATLRVMVAFRLGPLDSIGIGDPLPGPPARSARLLGIAG